MRDGLDRAETLKLIGGSLIALAVLLLLPMAGSGSGSGHEPGTAAGRTLSGRDDVWVAAAIAGSVGLGFLVISGIFSRANVVARRRQPDPSKQPLSPSGEHERWESEPLDDMQSDTDWAHSLAAALRRHAEQPDTESIGHLSRLTGQDGEASVIVLEARRLLWLARRETAASTQEDASYVVDTIRASEASKSTKK